MAKKKKEVKTQEVEEVVEEVKEIEEVEKDIEEDEYVEITLEERLANIEKRINFTFIVSLFILALSLITMIVVMNGGVKTTNTEENNTEETASSSYDTSAFKEITAKDIESESKGQTIVVMVGRQGCGYCAAYAPIITEVAEKHNVTVRYVDFAKIADVSTSTLLDKDSYDIFVALEGAKGFEEAGKTAMAGTPATLFIKNNKVIYFIRGAATEEILENAFSQAGIK